MADLTLDISAMENDPPYPGKLPRKTYERELEALQVELTKAQRWVKEEGERVCAFFEGRDAAGKGGSIRRFMEYLNPRGARTVALAKPNETERGEWYFQRYVRELPTAGEIVLFDRSWYNRAGVEIVMGFCDAHEYGAFFRQVPELERSLVESGMRLFKLWFTVGQDEQRRRFDRRHDDPLRQWKLSPIDLQAIDKFEDYTRGSRFDARADRFPSRAVDDHQRQRQAARTPRVDSLGAPYPCRTGTRTTTSRTRPTRVSCSRPRSSPAGRISAPIDDAGARAPRLGSPPESLRRRGR